jgi:hypothetical protein
MRRSEAKHGVYAAVTYLLLFLEWVVPMVLTPLGDALQPSSEAFL